MTNCEYAKEIASTILSQLGGNKFITMTGSKLSYTTNEKEQPILKCSLSKNFKYPNNISLVHFTYNVGKDLYELDFINTRLHKSFAHYDDVHAEDLIPLFEKETGLYCYL